MSRALLRILRIGEPTPKPEIPIEGAEMIIPLICIVIFFLVMLFLFARFFFIMHSSDEKNMEKQDKIFRSRFAKKAATYHAATPHFRRPNTH